MGETIRFPLLAAGPPGPSEADQVIVVHNAVATLPRGGAAAYASLAPWKTVARASESPFACVVVEFEGNAAFTIGNGVTAIGLYGEILGGAAGGGSFKTLLGILGTNLTGTDVPVIPLDTTIAPALIGFSQKVSDIACYDAISVGGVGAAIALAEGNTVTVRLRPIHRRSWVG